MHGRFCRIVCCGLLLGLTGCEEITAPTPERQNAVTDPAPATQFDAATAGTVRGQVLWDGDIPSVPPLLARANPFYGAPLKEDRPYDNPNAPAIDAASRGVGRAVVFLGGVDPVKARPWHHPPVRVEQRQCLLHVLQGGADTHVGFVRRNAPVEMVSKDPWLHMLRCSESAFFTLAFPDPEQPLSPRLEKNGLVELSSGAGYYWMRGYLFVDDQPYYARTDAQGRFVLEQVPPGRYRLVCWAPNWIEDHHERDPDSALRVRLFFRPPAELEREIVVPPSGSVTVNFSLSSASFRR